VRQKAKSSAATALDHATPQFPVRRLSHVFRPVAISLKAAPTMHDAGCGNAVCLGQEMLELVFVGKIDADRHHEAIGAYPQGTAIGPLHCARLEVPGQQFKMIGKPNVVMGDKGDQIALRLFEGDVSIGVAEMRRLGQIEPSDPRIAKSRDKLGRTVGAAVADDEQLEVLLALPQHRLDRITDHIRTIVRRQQHAEARCHSRSRDSLPSCRGSGACPKAADIYRDRRDRMGSSESLWRHSPADRY